MTYKKAFGYIIKDFDKHYIYSKQTSSRFCNIGSNDGTAAIIDNGVCIGTHVCVVENVHIRMNAIICAGSIVMKSIPANEIWAGNPAHFIMKTDVSY